jgi:lipoprotein-releasing system ATP-binding protein
MNEIMIRARGIQKAFGDVEVLKGIDLDIPKNEITAITGASGAGKTTLLQILGTLHSPDNGELSIGDRPVHLLKGKELAQFRNRKIGFIFQFHRLLPEFNALENALMPAWILGNDGAREKDRAKRLETWILETPIHFLNYLKNSGIARDKPSSLLHTTSLWHKEGTTPYASQMDA